MSDRDQAAIDAEALLTTFPDSWSPSCRQVCDAVAAELRKRDEHTRQVAIWWAQSLRWKVIECEALESQLADERAAKQEIERLKVDRDMWITDDAKQNTALGMAIAERDQLRAELAALKGKMEK